jgi:hypothetical protein
MNKDRGIHLPYTIRVNSKCRKLDVKSIRDALSFRKFIPGHSSSIFPILYPFIVLFMFQTDQKHALITLNIALLVYSIRRNSRRNVYVFSVTHNSLKRMKFAIF